jgi:hypothetical protein
MESQRMTLYRQDETQLRMMISTTQSQQGGVIRYGSGTFYIPKFKLINYRDSDLELPRLHIAPLYAFPESTSKAFNMNVGVGYKQQSLRFQNLPGEYHLGKSECTRSNSVQIC